VSEWDLSGLTREPSQTVKPPRVKESAFSMECVLEHYYDMKVRRLLADRSTLSSHVLGRMTRAG
jgi:flavin reductase (DIM6/NTAB) family NADH-FMN oxidoreductase RutF